MQYNTAFVDYMGERSETMLTICLTSEIDSSTSDAARLEGLIAQVAEGDTAALAALYDATQAAVYAFALSLLRHREDAEDVRQDCFIAIHAAAHSYRPRGKPMAWIITIARNLCLHRLRARRHRAEVDEDDWAALLPDTAMPMEERVVLRACLGELREDERQIVTLYCVVGLRHREIAALLEMPLATVLSKYRRALKKLRRALELGEKEQ